MSSLTIQAVLAFISQASFHDTGRIKSAAERRGREVSLPNLSAAQVRETFKIGSTVELVGLANAGLNGARVRVTGHQAKFVLVDIRGTAGKMPADCCIPVDGDPDAPEDAPITRGDFVRITQKGKYQGAEAIVLGSKKNGRLSILMLGSCMALAADSGILTRIDPPASLPTYLVVFKSEFENTGTVTLLDTAKVKQTDRREYGKDYDGVTNFGDLTETEAKVIARAYKAKFESI